MTVCFKDAHEILMCSEVLAPAPRPIQVRELHVTWVCTGASQAAPEGHIDLD